MEFGKDLPDQAEESINAEDDMWSAGAVSLVPKVGTHGDQPLGAGLIASGVMATTRRTIYNRRAAQSDILPLKASLSPVITSWEATLLPIPLPRRSPSSQSMR